MVEIKNLNKQFNNIEILKNINLTIESNKTTVVIGPSGSGKTTLLRCVNVLETPDNGQITINNDTIDFSKHKLSKHEINKFRKKTGMVFQSFNLFPHRTALENIIEGPITVLKTPKAEAIKEAEILLDKIGLTDKRNNYPHQLSGGQQQRVAIARAIVNNPTLLIADEPTGNLDPETAIEIMDLLIDINKAGTTVMMATHAKEIVDSMQRRVVAIERGQIVRDELEGRYSEK